MDGLVAVWQVLQHERVARRLDKLVPLRIQLVLLRLFKRMFCFLQTAHYLRLRKLRLNQFACEIADQESDLRICALFLLFTEHFAQLTGNPRRILSNLKPIFGERDSLSDLFKAHVADVQLSSPASQSAGSVGKAEGKASE